MEWISDVSPGNWVRDRLAGQQRGSLRSYVPGGFEAYVRIFPPLERQAGELEDPQTEQSTWQGVAAELGVPWRGDLRSDELLGLADAGMELAQVVGQAEAPETRLTDQSQTSSDGEIPTEPGSNSTQPDSDDEASQALQELLFGLAGEPTGQARRWWSKADSRLPADLVAQLDDEAEQQARRWHIAADGVLSEDQLRPLARVLAQHTTTPGEGVAAVWEGWGGLSGGMAAFGLVGGSGPAAWFRRATLGIQFRFGRGPHGRPVPPALPAEVIDGPRLEVPDRAYFLFSTGVNAFTDGTWRQTAPWRGPFSDESVQTPSILWPADQAWVLVVEIDEDTAYLGGSRTLAKALLACPDLEAARADLSGDATVPHHHN